MLVMTLEYMFHNSHRYFTEILELVRSLNATQNDPQPPSTTPNESLRLVGGFYSTLPFMSPSTTPNVSFRHVGGFLRPLALDHGPIDPQRVEVARWGLPLALNDPQRVEMTRWGLSSSPRPRPRPQRPSPSAKQSRSDPRGTGLSILKKKILRNCCHVAVYQAAEHMDVSN